MMPFSLKSQLQGSVCLVVGLFTAMGLFTAKTLLVLFFTSLPQRSSYATQKWYRVQSSLRNLSSPTFAE